MQKKSLFVFVLLLAQMFAIGVSPGSLTFENVLKEGYAEGSFSVSEGSGDPSTITVSVGGELADWVTLSENEFVIEGPGIGHTVTVMVSPPATAQSRWYSGNIDVLSKPLSDELSPEEDGFYVTATAGSSVSLAVYVTGEEYFIISLTEAALKRSPIEAGDPIEVTLSLSNDGNVDLLPVAMVEVLDSDGNIIATSEKVSAEEVLKPTTQGSYGFSFPMDVAEGSYTLRVSLFSTEDSTESIAQQELSLEVLEKGGLEVRGEVKEVEGQSPGITVGSPFKITTQFQSMGTAIFDVKYRGEVYQDGELIELIESDPQEVGPGESVTLLAYFTPEEAGNYVVNGYVLYGSHMDGPFVTTFSASPMEVPSEPPAPPTEPTTTTEEPTEVSEEVAKPDMTNLVLVLILAIALVALALSAKHYFAAPEEKPKPKKKAAKKSKKKKKRKR